MSKPTYRTRAHFQINGQWRVVTWTNQEPNDTAAIITKADEFGASRYNLDMAEHNDASVTYGS